VLRKHRLVVGALVLWTSYIMFREVIPQFVPISSKRITLRPELSYGTILVDLLWNRLSSEIYQQYEVRLHESRLVRMNEKTFSSVAEERESMATAKVAGGSITNCYRSPMLMSPDGRYVAFCTDRFEKGIILDHEFSNELVILDARTKSEWMRPRLNGRNKIRGICWSPDSGEVAVLSYQEEMGIGPLELLYMMAGHPVPYMTFYLDLYHIRSRSTSHIVLERGCKYGFGRILDWQAS